MPEIIAIGEVLVEIMRPDSGQPLDLPGTFKGPYPSGAPAIFAVAAARLGLDVGFIGAVGEDAFGRVMRSCFAAEGVEDSQLQTPAGYSTGAAFVAYNQQGEREFVFHIRHAAAGQLSADRLSKAYFRGVKWLHLSGSTLYLNQNSRDACLRSMEFTLAQNGRISLDPNLRLELMSLEQSREILSPFLAAADLLLPTLGELRAISGKEDEVKAVQVLGLKDGAIIAVKRGSQGSSIFAGDRRLDIGGFSVQEIDPTGAGDCFSAAFIAGLEAGWSLAEVGKFANAAGALAVTRMGPMEGAASIAEVKAMVKKSVE